MPTQYLVFPAAELIYSTNANANTPLTAPVICIDRTNPACVDYQYGAVYATHSKLTGLMIRSAPSILVKTGWEAELTIENTSLGPTAYKIYTKFTLQGPSSGAIYIGQQEMVKLAPGTWEISGTLTPVPPIGGANPIVYVMLSKFQPVVN